ncbi:hypothetical protein PHMEG_0009789 [Phytophthora megakarya]|uniref:Uncharacterized protein n=1 Tax=Phytophthora megakarya TaxID=4795 RepID=A0A225WFY6_9STRA|nr:hypothetical protein PHMEG_0009789 [Phytophthora megakarya]
MGRENSKNESNKPELLVMATLGIDKLSSTALEANKTSKAFLVYWLLKHDNSINENTKDVLKKMTELDNSSPAQLELLNSKRSFDDAREVTKVRAKWTEYEELALLDNLPPAELAKGDMYQT